MADSSDSQTRSLVESLRTLEEKLESGDGIEPLVALLSEIEGLLGNVREDALANMRTEIRGVIDRLLTINGDLQRVAQLKKILP